MRASAITARSIWIGAALVMAACIAVMSIDYAGAVRAAPIDEALLKELQIAARADVSKIQVLDAERERVTRISTARDKRTRVAIWILIVSSVVFLLGAKWSLRIRGRRRPSLERILALSVTGKNGRTGRRRRAPARPEGRDPERATHEDGSDRVLLEGIFHERGRGPEAAIPILQDLQGHEGYLRTAALEQICRETEITPAQITSVLSFYPHFRQKPVGEQLVKVCHGTACHVAGARSVSDEIRRRLGIAPEDDTDPEGRFTVQEVACLGCCTLAPVVQVDDRTFGHLSTERVEEMLDRAADREPAGPPGPWRAAGHREPQRPPGEIRVGLGSCCVAGGSEKVRDALAQAVAISGAGVSIKRVGCVGMCHRTPLVEALVPGQPAQLYANVRPEHAAAIVRRHFPASGLRGRLTAAAAGLIETVRGNSHELPLVEHRIEVRDPPVAAFLGPQKHIATELCGCLDPVDLDEYLRHDGFKALERSLRELSPEEIVDEVRRSGLRGRGGAGFPTGDKWARVRAAVGPDRYVICNGDEGDPGAFMDRMLMESFPYRVIEGMAIAARAVGAAEGVFYIRAEYPLAVKRIRDAIERCEQRGLLGENILDRGFRLRLRIMEGAGAFVCGEETALLASIEGRRGSPRLRPPFPADEGLWGRPTLVNNVETYTTIPWLIRHGAAALAALGTETSRGTKVFALAGKVRRGGLIEVPMGVTIRRIVEEIGGGIRDGHRFKAVQIGGPSGGCIPATLADTPVDYEALREVGAIMGSGGLVVMDETDCMVDIARYFLAFTQDQSCGKCTFCRVGTRRMLDILERLCTGAAQPSDVETLEELARSVGSGSLCGLGKTAPNPVLSTLRYFRDEYQAHVEGRCPAGKCPALITYRVNDRCIGCTLCAQRCPVDAIAFTPYEKHEIDDQRCTRCDVCRTVCPEEAIDVS